MQRCKECNRSRVELRKCGKINTDTEITTNREKETSEENQALPRPCAMQALFAKTHFYDRIPFLSFIHIHISGKMKNPKQNFPARLTCAWMKVVSVVHMFSLKPEPKRKEEDDVGIEIQRTHKSACRMAKIFIHNDTISRIVDFFSSFSLKHES